jgi:hypothetical protein
VWGGEVGGEEEEEEEEENVIATIRTAKYLTQILFPSGHRLINKCFFKHCKKLIFVMEARG